MMILLVLLLAILFITMGIDIASWRIALAPFTLVLYHMVVPTQLKQSKDRHTDFLYLYQSLY